MPNRETWEFINSFAPWFSALATLCAVLVSLYLALRTSRPRVRVSSSIARVIPTGRRLKDGAEFFKIHVVNHGFRDVVVSGIMWKQRVLRRQSYGVVPPADPLSTKVPAKLQHGDQADFLFPTETFPLDSSELLKTLGTAGPSSLQLRLLSVGVYTSTGEEFLSPLNLHIRKWLIKQASQYRLNLTSA